MSAVPRRVVVFDLDDTLYLERNYARSGFAAVDLWAQQELRLEGFFARAWNRFEAGSRERVFDRVLEECGIAATPELVARMVETYRTHRPEIALEPDAADWLAANAARCDLALITDGFAVAQNAKVDALGLRGLGFAPVIVTDEWGRESWKPNPRAYLAVQQHFAGAQCRFAYVADNPAKDFLAPRALGWDTVQIARVGGVHAGEPPSPDHAADCRIESLAELNAVLGLECPA